jgi:hypothetical protein
MQFWVINSARSALANVSTDWFRYTCDLRAGSGYCIAATALGTMISSPASSATNASGKTALSTSIAVSAPSTESAGSLSRPTPSSGGTKRIDFGVDRWNFLVVGWFIIE